MNELSGKNRLMKEVDAISREIREIAKWLYLNPETPREERKAVEYLTAYLHKNGFEIERNTAGLETAFIARYKKYSGGPRVGFLAEYDALPGVGHGCGHNLIAASCIGGAVALAKVLDGPGEIIVFGTPDEEYDGGKILMAQAGVFKGLNAAMQIHFWNTKGFIGTSSSPHQTMVISFKGKASHSAATSSEGINALNAVLISFAGLHALQQNLRPGTKLPATITHGGGSPNAVPEFAQFRIHVTTVEADYLPKVVEKVKNCARAGALATGAEVDIWEGPVYKSLPYNKPLANVLRRQIEELGYELEDAHGLQAATDVGNVGWECPTVFGLMDLGTNALLHSREFADATVGEQGKKGVIDAVKAMAFSALEIIEDEELCKVIDADYRAVIFGGR